MKVRKSTVRHTVPQPWASTKRMAFSEGGYSGVAEFVRVQDDHGTLSAKNQNPRPDASVSQCLPRAPIGPVPQLWLGQASARRVQRLWVRSPRPEAGHIQG